MGIQEVIDGEQREMMRTALEHAPPSELQYLMTLARRLVEDCDRCAVEFEVGKTILRNHPVCGPCLTLPDDTGRPCVGAH